MYKNIPPSEPKNYGGTKASTKYETCPIRSIARSSVCSTLNWYWLSETLQCRGNPYYNKLHTHMIILHIHTLYTTHPHTLTLIGSRTGSSSPSRPELPPRSPAPRPPRPPGTPAAATPPPPRRSRPVPPPPRVISQYCSQGRDGDRYRQGICNPIYVKLQLFSRTKQRFEILKMELQLY